MPPFHTMNENRDYPANQFVLADLFLLAVAAGLWAYLLVSVPEFARIPPALRLVGLCAITVGVRCALRDARRAWLLAAIAAGVVTQPGLWAAARITAGLGW
jgi:hypothetical protein